MEVRARTNQTRISTRKVRLVADSVRDLSLEDALVALSVVQKRGARVIEKTLKSALANAENNSKLDKSKLRIESIIVNEGPALKRYHASTRGRIHPYKRRSTNVSVTLKEVNK